MHLPQKLNIFRFLPVTRLLFVYLQWDRCGRGWDSHWSVSQLLLALVWGNHFILSLEYTLIQNLIFKGRHHLGARGYSAISIYCENFTRSCRQFDCVARCLELLAQFSIDFLLRWLVARHLNLDEFVFCLSCRRSMLLRIDFVTHTLLNRAGYAQSEGMLWRLCWLSLNLPDKVGVGYEWPWAVTVEMDLLSRGLLWTLTPGVHLASTWH